MDRKGFLKKNPQMIISKHKRVPRLTDSKTHMNDALSADMKALVVMMRSDVLLQIAYWGRR